MNASFLSTALGLALGGAPPGSLAEPPDPSSVLGGAVVPECAWPTAGVIYSNDGRCTAVYVGGRTILTASHCIISGFRISQSCTIDADCPDVSALGGAVTLECESAEGLCLDPNNLVSNTVHHVRFGTEYVTDASDGEARKSIRVLYCKKAGLTADALPGQSDDFAYCILAEEPNLQPVPISVPCENQAELTTGTTVTAVGFGKLEPGDGGGDSGGIKRWATATLPNDSWASQSVSLLGASLEWTTAGGAPVTNLASGDSGGPLYAQMSDGTWRVIGIAQTNHPKWVIPFHHIDWLVSDPNIEVADLLPCHDATGQWTGGASCGSVPTQPDQGSGAWARGEHACHTDAVLPRTNLCPPVIVADSSPEDFAVAPPPAAPASRPDRPRGCAVGSDAVPSLPFLLILVPLFRRRLS